MHVQVHGKPRSCVQRNQVQLIATHRHSTSLAHPEAQNARDTLAVHGSTKVVLQNLRSDKAPPAKLSGDHHCPQDQQRRTGNSVPDPYRSIGTTCLPLDCKRIQFPVKLGLQ